MTYIKSATVIEWKWQNVQGIISDWQSAWRIWTKVHDIVQEIVIKNISKKKKWKRQNNCLSRPYKELRQEEKLKAKEKGNDLNAEYQRIARRNK